MKDEALRLALEALEQIKQETFHPAKVFAHNHAITAIKQALQQPEPEPMIGTKTWLEDGKVFTEFLRPSDIYKEPKPEPVAWSGVDFDIKTSPPKREWQGLTDEERSELIDKYYFDDPSDAFMKEFEAKLKEKNG